MKNRKTRGNTSPSRSVHMSINAFARGPCSGRLLFRTWGLDVLDISSNFPPGGLAAQAASLGECACRGSEKTGCCWSSSVRSRSQLPVRTILCVPAISTRVLEHAVKLPSRTRIHILVSRLLRVSAMQGVPSLTSCPPGRLPVCQSRAQYA
jgi:hypothetical protein